MYELLVVEFEDCCRLSKANLQTKVAFCVCMILIAAESSSRSEIWIVEQLSKSNKSGRNLFFVLFHRALCFYCCLLCIAPAVGLLCRCESMFDCCVCVCVLSWQIFVSCFVFADDWIYTANCCMQNFDWYCCHFCLAERPKQLFGCSSMHVSKIVLPESIKSTRNQNQERHFVTLFSQQRTEDKVGRQFFCNQTQQPDKLNIISGICGKTHPLRNSFFLVNWIS